jgi:hypothetical protein
MVGVYTVTDCTIGGSSTGRDKKYFCLLQNVQTDPLPHPDICSVGKGGSVDGGKAAGA